jgi:hypothetical protein
VTLTLTLAPDVHVISLGGGAVNLTTPAPVPGNGTANGLSLTINAIGTAANPIVIDNTANHLGDNNWGLVNQPGSAGAAVINAKNTQISVKGTVGDAGIWAISYGLSPSNVASVTWSGPSITSSGGNSTGIQAENRGNGNAVIDASGNISDNVGNVDTSSRFTFLGLAAVAGSTLGGGGVPPGTPGVGNASVIYRSGTIDVQGNFASGIFASGNAGSARIETLPGTTIVVSQELSSDFLQPVIDAFSSSTAATDIVASTITINGSPMALSTNFRSNPTGIRATTDVGGPVSVTYTGPGITVHGGAASVSLPLPVPPAPPAPAAAPPWMPLGPLGRSWQTAPTRSVSSPTAVLCGM